MSENVPFTVESFYAFLEQKQLMAAKCDDCNTVVLPPKPMCTKCMSTNLKWVNLKGTGKLLSYTVIHIAPEQFQSLAPYIVGIVEFEDGLKLPGMICGTSQEKLKIGMPLKIQFKAAESLQWPAWGRYCFCPV